MLEREVGAWDRRGPARGVELIVVGMLGAGMTLVGHNHRPLSAHHYLRPRHRTQTSERARSSWTSRLLVEWELNRKVGEDGSWEKEGLGKRIRMQLGVGWMVERIGSR